MMRLRNRLVPGLDCRRLDPTSRQTWYFRFLFAFVACVVESHALDGQSFGQSFAPPTETVGIENNQERSTEIRINQLGKPPPEIAALIQRGSVRLITGGQPIGNPESLPVGRRLAGETRFTFRYRYDSQARWQIERGRKRDSRDETIVQIRVRFRSVKLITSHEVWLLEPPRSDLFWDDSIVRHEFDHVRISSDPRIEKLFLDAAKKLELIRVPLSEVKGRNGQIENSKVQAKIESEMKQALDNTTDYVRIRYRELDRLTRHGMLPLPDDSGLIEANGAE